ncbi:hypothetical protein GCM10025883_35060 [Mobilicoccus caccae]|uniref:PIN domain-containing protein n=1 Tax=Mobilicoccus caccae TaxID=1859295 RepID=A0ABQ6IWM1_9MICO|nr:type II toxin-antitoxin system VapC family toxin [Mobilicoccus caccae]GMA41461.1 hypothetical protein GCM10025883_35060 [Mobilicoccus caccae]
MTVVLDTSALRAIIFGEDDAEAIMDDLLARDDELLVSAATMVEASIVVTARRGTTRAGAWTRSSITSEPQRIPSMQPKPLEPPAPGDGSARVVIPPD